MGLRKAIEQINRTLVWSLLSTVLALIFGGLAIYTEFFRKLIPDLRFEIVSNASVLDVREDVPKLEILYDGTDISKAEKSMRVIVLRVLNAGKGDILTVHYDKRFPVGFNVSDAEIIRTELLFATSDYLSNAVTLRTGDDGTYLFEPVILESGESFTIKLLVLHSKSVTPGIVSVGKIAGDEVIEIVDTTTALAEPGFFRTTYSGSIWVQLLRLASYFFGFGIVMVAITLPVVTLASVIGKRTRRKRVKKFKAATKIKLAQEDKYIFDGYIEHDILFLHTLMRAASDPQLTNKVEAYDKSTRDKESFVSDEPAEIVMDLYGARRRLRFRYPINEMRENKFLIKKDDSWVICPDKKRTLASFMEFLQYLGAA